VTNIQKPGQAGHVVVVGNLTIDDVVLPDGQTLMARLGGNTVHSATAVLACGVPVALVTRKGEDFPPAALDVLARAGADVSGVVAVEGPTVRNWVIYEADGRRHWLYRTPPGRSAEVAPQPVDLTGGQLEGASVVHVAAMPLANAERVVAEVRRLAPGARITLDTHEDWVGSVRERLLDLARLVDVFEPSLEELQELTGADSAEDGLRALADAGLTTAVVKAGADGAYLLEDGGIVHVPALPIRAVDTTGAGDAFCGGLAAGLASGLDHLSAVALGVVTAGTAVGASGSLRLLETAVDQAGLMAAGHTQAGQSREVGPAVARLAGAATATDRDQVGDDGTTGDGTDSYAIDVMRREIAMIPEVVATAVSDPGGRLTSMAKSLLSQDISHLWLTGCGDSAFAGQAAALAFQRHTDVVPHASHALDLARYEARFLPAGSAVLGVSFSGRVGRTTEALIQAGRFGHPTYALTNAPDGQLARASGTVVPLEVTTLGFSPGTSTYVAMLGSLLRLAAALSELSHGSAGLAQALAALPDQAARTLDLCAEPALVAAQRLQGRPWTTFLGAGPGQATARFGAAKLFEGPQQLAVSTNLEEWAHEEYFVTNAGDPVVLVNPSGAGHDRGLEILAELRFLGALPIVVSDRRPPPGASADELWLPLCADVPEELSPVTAALPLALLGFHLAELGGKQSYNFPNDEARTEHYDTIHRATVGEPA
jgi:sugar/nucleoside kinase (ribokinase family)/fructoselysine-6-P-deglycase FrlB-like protein